MCKIFTILMFLGLFSIYAVEIKYGDFEDITGTDKVKVSGWNWKHSWYCKPKGKYSKITIDEQNMRTGQGALLLDGQGARAFLSRHVKDSFTKDQKLTFSFWCKTENMKGLTWIRLKSGKKNLVSIALKSKGNGNMEWKEFSKKLIIPSDCKSLSIEINTTKPNDGKVWFDDFSLEESKEPVVEDNNIKKKLKASDCVVPLKLFPSDKILWNGSKLLKVNGKDIYRGKINRVVPLYAKWQFIKPWQGICVRLRKITGNAKKIKINIDGLSTAWIELKHGFTDYLIGKSSLKKIATKNSYRGSVVIYSDEPCVIEIEDFRIMPDIEIGVSGAYINSPEGVIEPGEKPILTVMMFNRIEKGKKITGKLKLRNYSGKVVSQQEFNIQLKASGTTSSKITLPVLKAGYFSSEITTAEGDYYGNGIIVLPRRSKTTIPRPFIGINKFGDLYPYTSRYFVHRFQVHLSGNCLTKTENGTKLSNKVIGQINYCKTNGITPIGYLCIYPMSWHLPKGIYVKLANKKIRYNPKKFEEYAFQLANKLKGKVKEWELIGEIDQYYQRLENGIDDYNEMIKSGVRGIKRAIPDAKITGLSVADPIAHSGWGMVKKEWPKLKNHLSGVYADIYPFGAIEQGMADKVKPETHLPKELAQLAAIVGPKKTIGVSEAGYKIGSDTGLKMWSYNMRMQGIMQVRAALITASFKNGGEYMAYHAYRRKFESGWGMSYKFGKYVNPFPALGAYANCGRMLLDADRPNKIELKNPDIWLTSYRKGKGTMAVLWNSGNDDIQLIMPKNIDFKAVDIAGSDIKPFTALKLTGSPVYICFPKISHNKIHKVLDQFKFASASVKTEIRLDKQGQAKICLRNISEQKILGKLTVSIKSGKKIKQVASENISIDSGKKLIKFFELQTLSKLDKESILQTLVECNNGEVISSEKLLDIYSVHYVKPAGVLEMAAELKKSIPINLDSAEYVLPVHAIAYKYWQTPQDLSVKLWTGWNKQYFVISAVVTDKKHFQKYKSGHIWAQDCIHMGFETGNDNLPSSGTDSNDYEIGMALSPEGPYIHGWKTADKSKGMLKKCLLDITRKNGKTLYNVAIPWSYLGMKAFKNRLFGFNFFVPNSKGEQTALYGMGLTRGINNGKDPGVFKRFILQ
jgi:hypothetical protein